MMYRVKEEYRNYQMKNNEKACAVDLDVDEPIEVLRFINHNVGGTHKIRYYENKTGEKVVGYMDIDMLEEWK